ncbi:hypothetical protein NEAUS06_2533, partial [Nematocida ausubeli]
DTCAHWEGIVSGHTGILIKIKKYSLYIHGRIKENITRKWPDTEKAGRPGIKHIRRTRAQKQVYQGKLSDIDKCGQGSKQMDKGPDNSVGQCRNEFMSEFIRETRVCAHRVHNVWAHGNNKNNKILKYFCTYIYTQGEKESVRVARHRDAGTRENAHTERTQGHKKVSEGK